MASWKERDHPSSSEFDAHATIRQGVQSLLAEMQQGKSERLQHYLDFCARFHRYSFHNQILIQMQCPNATHVAGYRKWQEMGYQVRQGETGIVILAPRPYTRRQGVTEEEERAV